MTYKFADQMTDQFADHARLLKGERVDLNADDPISGWFRTRKFKGGPLLPVMIWRSGDFDDIGILVEGKYSTVEGAGWPYIAKMPVSREAYEVRMATGRWPDVDGTVADQANGNNNPPTDPATLLAEQIDAAQLGAAAYAEIRSDEMAAKAQTLRSRLIELSGQADKQRTSEKEPHLEAGRAVDAKWQPLVKAAKGAADAIRAALSVFETAKFAKQQAADRAAQEATRKARAAAEKAGAPAPPPVAPSPPPAAPARIKGGAGRAASVATITQVQSVADWGALAAFMCLQPDVQVALLKCANSMLKADATAKIPGVVTQQTRDVK